MPHLHLPADHGPDDLELAASLARALRSRDLYVTWSSGKGTARPVTPVGRPRHRGLSRLRRALAPRRVD